jgi:hypothetical protein
MLPQIHPRCCSTFAAADLVASRFSGQMHPLVPAVLLDCVFLNTATIASGPVQAPGLRRAKSATTERGSVR